MFFMFRCNSFMFLFKFCNVLIVTNYGLLSEINLKWWWWRFIEYITLQNTCDCIWLTWLSRSSKMLLRSELYMTVILRIHVQASWIKRENYRNQRHCCKANAKTLTRKWKIRYPCKIVTPEKCHFYRAAWNADVVLRSELFCPSARPPWIIFARKVGQ